jgi:hypothetical protein
MTITELTIATHTSKPRWLIFMTFGAFADADAPFSG